MNACKPFRPHGMARNQDRDVASCRSDEARFRAMNPLIGDGHAAGVAVETQRVSSTRLGTRESSISPSAR